MRDNSKCVFRCSGVCTCISSAVYFFRLRGLRLLIIDYLVVSLLLSGCFRACLYASLEIYASTNERRWGLRSKEHLKEHLRRGHRGRRLSWINRRATRFSPSIPLNSIAHATSSTLGSTAILAQPSRFFFPAASDVTFCLTHWNTRRRLSLHYGQAVFSCLITSIYRFKTLAEHCHVSSRRIHAVVISRRMLHPNSPAFSPKSNAIPECPS